MQCLLIYSPYTSIWAADKLVPLFMLFIQISLVSRLHVVDCDSHCLFIYSTASELSDMILKCRTRTLRGKNDFMTNFILKSSKNLCAMSFQNQTIYH